ncbi:hypothetical protein PS2_027877 [Malus domestica]
MFRDFFPHFLRDGWTGRERAESMLCVCVFCVNLKLLLSSFLKQASSLISQAPGSILLRVLGFHYVSFQAFSRSGKDFRFECKIFPQSRRLLFDVNQGAVSHFVLILEVIHRCSVKEKVVMLSKQLSHLKSLLHLNGHIKSSFHIQFYSPKSYKSSSNDGSSKVPQSMIHSRSFVPFCMSDEWLDFES